MAIRYSVEELINNKNFIKIVNDIYTIPVREAAARLSNLIDKHKEHNKGEFQIFSSPGRIEVIGNHTDHNHGEVLAAAVSVDLLAVVSLEETNIIRVNSIGYSPVDIDITNLDIVESEIGKSTALVRGVARGFVDRGLNIGGFTATTTSDVFKGAGMSSSAAFELLVSEIFNQCYNQNSVDPITKAIISQYSENVYFGKPSGLMDQSAIALGGISHIDFRNPKEPVAEKLDWPFPDISVVVINCGGSHANLTPEYASIRHEMEEVASFLGKEKLRDVKEDYFYQNIKKLKDAVTGRALLRSMHFFDENKRVRDVYMALKNRQASEVFRGISESGDSSCKLLQNCYVEGDPTQPIPLALSLVKRQEGVRGCRVHGGGFAGTILIFVEKEHVDKFKDKMAEVFGEENIYLLKIRNTGTKKLCF